MEQVLLESDFQCCWVGLQLDFGFATAGHQLNPGSFAAG